MAYIYVITNDINTKQYVGLTFSSIQERWRCHIKDSKSFIDRPLYRAFNKYGIEHFHIKEIEECDSLIANSREQYWIEKLDTYKNGYNATRGGEGRQLYDHQKIIELYQKYLNTILVAKEMNCCTDLVADVVRAAGYDTITIQQNQQRKIHGKKCEQYDLIDGHTINIFDTQMDAGRWIALNKLTTSTYEIAGARVGQVCAGKRKSAYGFGWRYAERDRPPCPL